MDEAEQIIRDKYLRGRPLILTELGLVIFYFEQRARRAMAGGDFQNAKFYGRHARVAELELEAEKRAAGIGQARRRRRRRS